jgi:hypothetical protein
MADWYYYNESGEKVGPIRGRELKRLAQQGTVTPETRIEDENGRIALARNVTGLTFPEVARSELVPLESSTALLPPSADTGNRTDNTAENLEEQDFERLREDAERLQKQQEQITRQAPPTVGANPFTVSVPTGNNPFVTPKPTPAVPVLSGVTTSNAGTTYQGTRTPTPSVPLIRNAALEFIDMKDGISREQRAEEQNSGGSWQITLIGIVALLVVGGLGWYILERDWATRNEKQTEKRDNGGVQQPPIPAPQNPAQPQR